MKRQPILLLTVIVLTMLAASCKKVASLIDPADANALTSVLVIPGSSKTSGNPPAPTGTPSSPALVLNQSTLSTNAGAQFIVPFTYTSNSGYSTCYVQVDGATNGFFTVPNSGAAGSPNSGTIAVPITIPSNVLNGSFCITYCIADRDGNISNVMTTCVTIKEQLDCSTATASGSEGLTFTNVNMGNTAGDVDINYDTYSVPDRIDVYQGTTWLTGTGANPGSPIPPLSDCSSPLPGFIGASGTLSVSYNPSNGKVLTVVVSGCMGGGTAWDWSMTCP
ncbi:MAG: hypothetical protein IPM95_11455 [Sphingobacteriales bacterium]|jgi:hypothetical protein|nr:hypothetical protein [Sphingobacteriales bacterium]